MSGQDRADHWQGKAESDWIGLVQCCPKPDLLPARSMPVPFGCDNTTNRFTQSEHNLQRPKNQVAPHKSLNHHPY